MRGKLPMILKSGRNVTRFMQRRSGEMGPITLRPQRGDRAALAIARILLHCARAKQDCSQHENPH
jgi:hypothetical protein